MLRRNACTLECGEVRRCDRSAEDSVPRQAAPSTNSTTHSIESGQ